MILKVPPQISSRKGRDRVFLSAEFFLEAFLRRRVPLLLTLCIVARWSVSW
jgi:hypothetical protein